MLKKWFQFALAGVTVLVVAFLIISNVKILPSNLVASVIDAIPGVTVTDSTEPIPTEEPASEEISTTEATENETIPAEDSTETTSEETSTTEPVSPLEENQSLFAGILENVTNSVKDLIESDPIVVEQKSLSLPVTDTIPSVKGVFPQLKVFVLTQDMLESAVNNWLAAQKNIIVDDIKVSPYEGGAYLVVMNYRTGGNGNTATRLKVFATENPEIDANTFLSSLNGSQRVRSFAVVAGSYIGSGKTGTVPIVFVVYE